MFDLNKVYQGDCLDVMREIDDKSIDMILCDLPYELTALKQDKLISFELLWEQYRRIIKDNGTIALFGAQPFTTHLIQSNIQDFKYCWYWIKNQATNFFHANRMPTRKIEEICIFGNNTIYNAQITDGHKPTSAAKGCSNGNIYHGGIKRNYTGGKTTRMPTNVLEFKVVDNYHRFHPSQKPVELCEYLIKTYTNAGDLVLDNAAGSGTTGVAAIKLKRNFILIEKDASYAKICEERCSYAQEYGVDLPKKRILKDDNILF